MSELKVNKISPETGTAITLGDSGDTFTIPSGATITNSGTANGFGDTAVVGQVLQKQVTEIVSFTHGADSWVDVTGISLTITPSSSSSKILIMGTVNLGTFVYGMMRILRDTTVIGVGTGSVGSKTPCHIGNQNHDAASTYECFPHPLHWIDSPSTTSATTYKAQFRGHSSSTVYINREYNSGDDDNRTVPVSTITLMELTSATVS